MFQESTDYFLDIDGTITVLFVDKTIKEGSAVILNLKYCSDPSS